MQVRGADLAANFVYANKLLSRVRHVPGVADARIQQSSANPTLNFDVDRTRAQYIGLTERDVTNRLVVNLAGSSQVAPTYWLNPHNGVSYPIVMQTPQYQIDSLGALQTLPITGGAAATLPILGGVAKISRTTTNTVVSQYNIQPIVQIYATPQGRDLGAVAQDLQAVVDAPAKDAPKGSSVVLLGQVKTETWRRRSGG
jgi:multidrug efflux pump subunit AcrB